MANDKALADKYASEAQKKRDQNDPPRPDTAAVPIVETAPKGITQYGDRRRSYFRKRDYSS